MYLNHVFRLRAPTVRHYKGRWYFSFEDHPTAWGRPYKTLQAVTAAVARKMAEEWQSRANRLEKAA